MSKKISPFVTFFRYNIVAGIATTVDFAILVLFTEVFGLWYMFSTFIGAVAGGVTAFIFQRNWAFMKRDGKLSVQAVKYLLIWIVSILLNLAGMYIFVDFFECRVILSKIIVAIIIGIGFNFVMQKYWVFRKENKIERIIE